MRDELHRIAGQLREWVAWDMEDDLPGYARPVQALAPEPARANRKGAGRGKG